MTIKTKSEAREVSNDINQQLKVIKSELANLKDSARPAIEDKITEIGANVREFLDTSKATATEKMHQAEDIIRENPVRNTAIAFVAGLVLASIFTRK